MLQFITHPSDRMTILEEIQKAVDGGCKWIQLRLKDRQKDEIIRVAKDAKEICKPKECILIIDDHADIAKELSLDGVHLGKSDMPLAEARAYLGEEFIIGATANTLDDIMAIRHLDIDYIGLGPFRFTSTKQNLSPTIGIEGYRSIMNGMKANGITIPVVAIGGITFDDIDAIMETGVDGIAVSGGLINAPELSVETARMIERLENIVEKRYS